MGLPQSIVARAKGKAGKLHRFSTGAERRLMVMEADLCSIGRIRAHVLRDVA
ncbi:hypothetical protein [Methylobacterium sp. Leaf399]|uniref:hypothetical protein n=1 Tax=Methylobacterium sp. Leaf399 TaxID=1736364 RepID=UPI000B169488|nr:hypothetical protein [Methylobacterium sp. Leaf399]